MIPNTLRREEIRENIVEGIYVYIYKKKNNLRKNVEYPQFDAAVLTESFLI